VHKKFQILICQLAIVWLLLPVMAVRTLAQVPDRLNVTITNANNYSDSLIYCALPLPNGQVLAVGDSVVFISSANKFHTNIVRLNSNGSVDDTFQTSLDGAVCLALQTNGEILVGGGQTEINGKPCYGIGRLWADGTLDTNFNAGYIDYGLYAMLVQPDGKILVAGGFSQINGQPCHGLARLNSDGSLDTNFNAGADGSVQSLILQPDGRLVVLGYFHHIGGQPRASLARLNSDGSLDASFLPVTISCYGNSGLGSPVGSALVLQPDGRILVGNYFDHVDGQAHTNLCRLNTDGSLDNTFNAQADLYNCWGVQTLALQTDGKILYGDDSPTMDGRPCPFFGRLNPDGSLDSAFATNLINSGVMVFSCALESDGRVIPTGFYTQLGGEARSEMGRLSNTGAATQSINYDGRTITWQRGGTSPEASRVAFEASTNGTNWIYLGDGSRTGGGWQLTNASVPAQSTIRARGFFAAGRYNGSWSYVESLYTQTNPVILCLDGHLGFLAGRFGFDISSGSNATVVVDISSNLFNWVPVTTNQLPTGAWHYSDGVSNASFCRYYRVHPP